MHTRLSLPTPPSPRRTHTADVQATPYHEDMSEHSIQPPRPQDDFYRHVNGTWLATHTIPSDRPSDGTFNQLHDQSELWERQIVEDASAGHIEGHNASLIAALYARVMDEDTLNTQGLTPLLPTLTAIANASTHAELAHTMGSLQYAGIGGILGAYVGTDAHDSSRTMLDIYQSGLSLPNEAYYREEAHAPIRQAWGTYMRTLFSLTVATPHLEDALLDLLNSTPSGEAPSAEGNPSAEASFASRISAVETALASHHRDSVANRYPLAQDNPMTWEQLRSTYPDFAWDEWAAGLHLPLERVETLNVSQPEYVEGATRIWAETSLDDLKLWLINSALDARASLMSADFVDASFTFHGRALAGTEELRPRWKRALSLVNGFLGEAVGRIWVERHFPPTHKEKMDALVAALLDAYRDALSTSEWMGEATRERALAKLDTFVPKIGYPDRWRDYSTLTLGGATLLEDVAVATAFHTEYEWAKLGKPVDRSEWFMTPQTVNAYYNPPLNEIVFPAAILQPPFFDPNADEAENFGAIGAVIGHEIGHGFDDQGSRYDADGNLENWWDDEDRARFEERTAALVAQYDVLTPRDLLPKDDSASAADGAASASAVDDAPGAPSSHLQSTEDPSSAHDATPEEEAPLPHVNGALTLGENIGDLAGLSIAWNAWKQVLAAQGLTVASSPIIDGQGGAERFFRAWARGWRTAIRPEFALQLLTIDPHSPAEFRCNQIVANMDAFAETFDVQPGDALWITPEERVRIW